MSRPISSQILPAVVFGGLPFYLGALFWFFPDRLSRFFKATGSAWPKLSERIYSPKAMKITGIVWWMLGVCMWASVLLG